MRVLLDILSLVVLLSQLLGFGHLFLIPAPCPPLPAQSPAGPSRCDSAGRAGPGAALCAAPRPERKEGTGQEGEGSQLFCQGPWPWEACRQVPAGKGTAPSGAPV